MKVGGTSLSHTLAEWAGPDRAHVHVFLDDLLSAPPEVLSRLAVVAGHIPFEALELIPQVGSTATVLRDPVARTLSHYRELSRSRQEHGGLTLDEFLHSDVYDVPSGNYQARQLAHTVGVARSGVDFDPVLELEARGGSRDELYPLQSLFDSTPLAFDEGELLRRATENLSSIDHVGVTDDLDRLAERLAPLFGAVSTSVPRLHVTPGGDAPELTAAQRRRIEERTAVDRELYEVAARALR